MIYLFIIYLFIYSQNSAKIDSNWSDDECYEATQLPYDEMFDYGSIRNADKVTQVEEVNGGSRNTDEELLSGAPTKLTINDDEVTIIVETKWK